MFPLLQIKNFSIEFKTESEIYKAVNDISFEVNRGEVVAIVGESGSGKSVTALSVLQLLPVNSVVHENGKILFSKNGNEEVDLLKLSMKQLRSIRGNEISMVFQEPMTSLNPVQTCGHQIMEAINIHQDKNFIQSKQRTIELFNEVNLPDPREVFKRYPHELSGGQKQRVMIAMAMCCKPSLLIADEPTTALDVTVQKTILKLLKKLQQENNMGVIYITHDLNLVSEIAHSVIVMYKGKIAETGNVRDIFLHPQHQYTKALLACRPVLYSKGNRLPVVNDFLKEKIDNSKETAKETNVKINEEVFTTTSAKQKMLVEVQNLKVYFPTALNFFGKVIKEFKAIDDVSFNIIKGETLGLVGESGCGKTTLGRALIKLIEPTSGNIYFEGRNISKISKEEMRKMRRDIQIIFQDPYSSLNPRVTIGNAIMEPLKVHQILKSDKQRKDKVISLLEKVELRPDHFNRYPHEFSGGQRQRICIARALGLNPGFIICDESVSALDMSIQSQILNLFNDLKKEFGFTSVFISHDFGVVKYISDRIMVMNKGRIEETGTANEIYLNPQTDYTKKLLASIPKGLVA